MKLHPIHQPFQTPRSLRISHPSWRRSQVCLVALCSLWLSSRCALAQRDPELADAGPEKLELKAVNFMNKGKWEQAHALFQKIIRDWGNDDFFSNQPSFGTLFYNRGYCEMRLKRFAKAVASFRKCHEEFDNEIDDGEVAGIRNVYWKTAVFQWAMAEQHRENYEEAVKRYHAFELLKPDPKIDSFHPVIYHRNLGMCHAKLDHRREAEDNVRKAFRLARGPRYRLPVSSLWPGFLGVLESYVRAKDEDETEGASAFVDKFGPVLLTEPLMHGYYAGRLLKMGEDSVEGDLLGLAWRLYPLVPKTDAVLLAGKLADPSKLSLPQKRALKDFQTKEEKGEPLEIATYFGLSKLYERVGDTRAQFAIFDYMATHYLKTSLRPSILYLATRAADNVREMADLQQHGLQFLQEFPHHELAPEVSSMLLNSLFFNGEYERCVAIAGDLRPTLALGSKERDLPDFVYAGSLYYLGRYKEAQPELDSHVENYPESIYRENCTYYQASNLTRLYEWHRAASLLDVWLEKYEPEDSDLLDLAYLDRGTCHFMLATPENNGNAKALDFAAKIIDNYPQSVVRDRAYCLRGDVQHTDSRFNEAEASYRDALEIAEEEDHFTTAASALMKLIPVSAAQEKHEQAIGFYDSFFKKYPDSDDAPIAAVTALASFKEAQPARLGEVLERIENIILELGQVNNAAGIEQALNSYTNFLLKENKPAEVIDILDRFPNKFGLKTLHAWLLMAKIGIIEDHLTSDGKMAARARAYYKSLQQDFQKSDLSDYILYKVGLKIAETNLFQSGEWFQRAAQSEDPEIAMRAELQMANIRARSGDDALQDQAIADLKRIRTNMVDSREIVGRATLMLARLYHQRQMWAQANEEWKAYIENRTFRDARPDALFKLGESYERLNKPNEALALYAQVTVLYAGHLDLSAEAVMRCAQIVWDRGDRVEAFRYINTYHFRMRKNDHLKVQAMAHLRSNFIKQLNSKREWKEEYLQVRDKFGEIKPVKKKNN